MPPDNETHRHGIRRRPAPPRRACAAHRSLNSSGPSPCTSSPQNHTDLQPIGALILTLVLVPPLGNGLRKRQPRTGQKCFENGVGLSEALLLRFLLDLPATMPTEGHVSNHLWQQQLLILDRTASQRLRAVRLTQLEQDADRVVRRKSCALTRLGRNGCLSGGRHPAALGGLLQRRQQANARTVRATLRRSSSPRCSAERRPSLPPALRECRPSADRRS